MSFNSPFLEFFDAINQEVDQFNRLLNSSGVVAPKKIEGNYPADSRQVAKQSKNNSNSLSNWFKDPWFADLGQNLIPPLDILDHEKEYEVHVSVPGIKEKKDINLEYHKDANEIVISGEIPDVTTEETKDSAKIRERRYGKFSRVVRLPDSPGIDVENIKANYTNGVLVLNVPKLKPTEEDKAKVYKIEVGDEAAKL
ncbi:chaperone protein HSP26 [Kluyveromyces lactis]|uniref:KLLA0F18909p n=1 Tax=Kluyveromyces lactis (strain ATCC 8585 / CBS 2359 / DSM 70799 / NBRC 1267 / NRRL Y-1140 / WM37) TaxID=284590 RepID=Q6CJG1_KLULA|nr:uncharacterized protein KLLA0_F18909g [Kluyveromyces lactis]CAG98636.1 KLLA0F18909p [Kluyveromyces lactis]|eukprot:XP_455928.1 uncharacterized protein KLLA0_F18909g [Kluyveromyces lactis]